MVRMVASTSLWTNSWAEDDDEGEEDEEDEDRQEEPAVVREPQE